MAASSCALAPAPPELGPEQPVAIVLEIAVELRQPAVGDDQELVGRGAQQVAVVRHEHERAFELRQRDRQRLARFQVEVVGRLVEEQEVGPLPHDQRQREPRFLAA